MCPDAFRNTDNSRFLAQSFRKTTPKNLSVKKLHVFRDYSRCANLAFAFTVESGTGFAAAKSESFLPGVTAVYNNGMLAAFGSAPRWVLRGPQDESRSRVSTIDAVVTLSPIFAVSQKQHFHFIFASSRARSSSALSSRMKPKRGYSSSRIR